MAIFNDSSQRWKIAALQGYLFTLNSERTAPAFRAGTDLVFRSSLWRANNNSFNTVGSDSYSDGVTVLDWKLRQWKVQIFGGYFVKTCLAGTSSDPCYPAQMTASLETFHPEGGSFKGTVKALISRFENRFLVTYPEAGGRSDCPVDLNTGLSTQAQPFLTCSSYTTDAPLLLSAISGTPNTPSETYDYSAARMVFPPTFSSPDSVGFVSSAARTFNFSATSNVAPGATLNPPSGPTVAYSRGACPGSGGLPADNLPTGTGINFRAGTNLTNPAPGLVYDPNGATIPAGTYNVNVCAQILPPLGPRRSQALAVRVGSQTSILSQTNLVVFSGIPFSRKIYASGNPTPSLSVENLTINDPFRFVNFRDDGDGSATVFGTLPYPFQLLTALCIPPSIFGPGTCPIVRAENGVSSDTERFNVTAVLAPTPTLVIPPDIEFVSGAPNSVTFLGINSATTPVLTMGPAASTISLAIPGVRNSNLAPTQPLPGAPWLTYRDLGNGSGVLSGTPPAETNTDLGLQITGDAQYVIQAKANFNVAVRPLPRFLTGENAFFTVGQAATPFPIRVANNATFSLDSSNLPQGFSLAWQSQRSLELRGNPSQLTGSGGQYFLPITAGNASGTDTQTVNVYVLEAPGLFTNTPVQQNLTLHAGVTTNIRMDSSGYPKAPPIAGSPAQLGTGMVLTKTQDTMPAGSFTLLSADPAVPNVTLHGGGILRFTPPAALRGNFTLQFRAVNGIGNPSLLTLNLRVVGAGDVNADGVTNCADVSLVRGSFGKRNGVTGYDVRADVNLDGIVDVRDLSLVSSKITPGTVCQ